MYKLFQEIPLKIMQHMKIVGNISYAMDAIKFIGDEIKGKEYINTKG